MYSGEATAWAEQIEVNAGGPDAVWGRDGLLYSIRSDEPPLLTGRRGVGGQPVLAIDVTVGNGPGLGVEMIAPGRDLILAGPDGVCEPVPDCDLAGNSCAGTMVTMGFAPTDTPEEHTLYFRATGETTAETLGDCSMFVVDRSGAAVARYAVGQPEPTTRPGDKCTGACQPLQETTTRLVQSPTPALEQAPVPDVPYGADHRLEAQGTLFRTVTAASSRRHRSTAPRCRCTIRSATCAP